MCRAGGEAQLPSNDGGFGAAQDTEEAVRHLGHAEFKHAPSYKQ